jgi:integrase
MTRKSFQDGYVSEPIRNRSGVAFIIRYRVRMGNGKWKHRSETVYGLSGKKAAREVLRQRLQDASTRLPEATEMSVRDFVEAYWKPYLDRRGVKPSTRQSYECALKLHIIPKLGDLLLVEVAPLQIETLVQAKLKTGLSPKSVRNLVGLLQGIFSLALDNDLISRSPVRSKHKPTIRRREKPVWTADQVRLIVDSVPHAYRALFVCAALTGARLGELLGLQWKHVDLNTRTMRIEQSLWQRQLVSPKTSGSVRTVPFGDGLAQPLLEHQQNTVNKQLEDFVFCKRDGTPLNPDVLRKDVLYPALDRLGIPRASGASGFHTFRHSAASFINAQTGNLKLAQKLLGHSTIDMTAEVYTHTSIEAEREAALAVERAIYGDLFVVVRETANRNNSAAVN